MSSVDSSIALLTEHLRYPPVSLLDDIINSINDLAERGVDSIEEGLKAAPPSILGFHDVNHASTGEMTTAADQARDEIENGAHQLETLLAASIDKNFDILEVFALRNMLGIPADLKDWVRLRHYEGLNFDLPNDAPTPASTEAQRKKARESMRLNRLLLDEHKRNTKTLDQLKALRCNLPGVVSIKPEDLTTEADSSAVKDKDGVLAFLSQTADLSEGSSSAPVSTTTSFALSQLPALKALLADLRPQMKDLGRKRQREEQSGEGEKTSRRQRFDYVEKQTRRHLEQKGLELGSMGEVIDGEWQGGDRRIPRGEVEELEMLVANVGNQPTSEQRG